MGIYRGHCLKMVCPFCASDSVPHKKHPPFQSMEDTPDFKDPTDKWLEALSRALDFSLAGPALHTLLAITLICKTLTH